MPDQQAGETSSATGLYGSAEGYDAYMGHWSAALAPLFLAFAAIEEPASVADIGCGTGNLLVAARSALPRARLVGIDPSTALLQKARARPELASVAFMAGSAGQLPLDTGSVDGCLSLLVLQEFSDKLGALRDMRRVTRPGGVVAACQWDFARMPVIATLMEAMAACDADAGARLAARPQRHFHDESELVEAWTEAGLKDVSAARIEVVRQYRDFDALWTSLLGGSTPSTLMLAALPMPVRDAVRRRMQAQLPADRSPAPLAITAEALAVRGRA